MGRQTKFYLRQMVIDLQDEEDEPQDDLEDAGEHKAERLVEELTFYQVEDGQYLPLSLALPKVDQTLLDYFTAIGIPTAIARKAIVALSEQVGKWVCSGDVLIFAQQYVSSSGKSSSLALRLVRGYGKRANALSIDIEMRDRESIF